MTNSDEFVKAGVVWSGEANDSRTFVGDFRSLFLLVGGPR